VSRARIIKSNETPAAGHCRRRAHFECWANLQAAEESALLQDDAVARRRVGQGPVKPSQHEGEARTERHRPEPIKEFAESQRIRNIVDCRIKRPRQQNCAERKVSGTPAWRFSTVAVLGGLPVRPCQSCF
jgi:hypothetical protein